MWETQWMSASAEAVSNRWGATWYSGADSWFGSSRAPLRNLDEELDDEGFFDDEEDDLDEDFDDEDLDEEFEDDLDDDEGDFDDDLTVLDDDDDL